MARAPKTFDDPLVLEAALEGLELQKKRIETQMAEIRIRLGKKAITGAGTEPRKRDLSVEARKRIAAAQKKRWAEYRKANANPK
jgi:hypothetical protein